MRMNVTLNYEEGIAAIDEVLKRMPAALADQERTVLKKAGNIIKKNTVRVMVQSDMEQRAKEIPPSNYDGSRPYVHMKDDVKATVKKDKLGNLYTSVKGGKMTGYKWGPVSDGHIARDGATFVPGNHFMAKAVNMSESDIEKLIDGMIRKVTDG